MIFILNLAQPLANVVTAIFGSVTDGAYCLGKNVTGKADVHKEIKEQQAKNFKLLAEKIDLVDRKVQLEIKEIKINLEAQIKNTKDEIIKEIKSGK